MGVILDTSVLVAAERGAIKLESLLESLGETPVAITAVTAAELLHGCHRAADPGVRARRFAFVEALLDLIPVLSFGLAEARRHAELWAHLAREGTMIGPHDLMIGATALAQGHLLATLNTKEFSRVAGLRLVSLERFSK
ncbi:MAG: type II toxin-antitoxin system VapC family toxin [Gemmatimonadales bacterium]